MHEETGRAADVRRVQSLLERARRRRGIDQIQALIVASEVLREHEAVARGPLDRIDRQLHTCLAGYTRGEQPGVPPEVIADLAGLAAGLGAAEAGPGEGP